MKTLYENRVNVRFRLDARITTATYLVSLYLSDDYMIAECQWDRARPMATTTTAR